jgi:prolyl-tRNA editing enzyme YbaK/EbsC (Cys-tRNA(Pro) deacylase)
VVVQYADKLNAQKLGSFVREQLSVSIPGDPQRQQPAKKYYNMRLAGEDDAFRLTGYRKNGICPIGIHPNLPLIITSNIAALMPPIMYMGAGHIDWKVAVDVNEFVAKTNCLVVSL